MAGPTRSTAKPHIDTARAPSRPPEGSERHRSGNSTPPSPVQRPPRRLRRALPLPAPSRNWGSTPDPGTQGPGVSLGLRPGPRCQGPGPRAQRPEARGLGPEARGQRPEGWGQRAGARGLGPMAGPTRSTAKPHIDTARAPSRPPEGGERYRSGNSTRPSPVQQPPRRLRRATPLPAPSHNRGSTPDPGTQESGVGLGLRPGPRGQRPEARRPGPEARGLGPGEETRGQGPEGWGQGPGARGQRAGARAQGPGGWGQGAGARGTGAEPPRVGQPPGLGRKPRGLGQSPRA